MEAIKANILFLHFKDKVPVNKQQELWSFISTVGDDTFNALTTLELYDANKIQIYSLVFGAFGIDRFIQGEIITGLLKLFFGAFTFGIWYIVDFFSSPKRAKNKNLKMILNYYEGGNNYGKY